MRHRIEVNGCEMKNMVKENWREMENRIIENGREVLTSITMDMQQRMNQGTKPKTDEVKIIYVPTPG
jgi:hypothetical protein